MKSFIEKSNGVMKSVINDMVLLEILPINYKSIKSNKNKQVTTTRCIYCYQHLDDLILKKIYILKYMYKITFEVKVIVICENCLKDISLLHEINIKPIYYNSDYNQQENSLKEKKFNENETNDNLYIYELLSDDFIKSIANLKYYIESFKNTELQIISLHKIFDIKLILKSFDKHKNILVSNYINIDDFERLNYFISNRFDIEKGHFDIKNEILINENLYLNSKKNVIVKKIEKLKMLQTEISKGNLKNLIQKIKDKEHELYKDVYFNLIMLNEVSKQNDAIFNKLGIERNHLNTFKCIYTYENFNEDSKKRIQNQYFVKLDESNVYKDNVLWLQVFIQLENVSFDDEDINNLYNKDELENTIIKYFKSDNVIMSKKNKIIDIEIK